MNLISVDFWLFQSDGPETFVAQSNYRYFTQGGVRRLEADKAEESGP